MYYNVGDDSDGNVDDDVDDDVDDHVWGMTVVLSEKYIGAVWCSNT